MADRFEQYIATVQDQIRWKRARAGLKEELNTHLLDQRDACMAQGMALEEAEAESLRQMGDPVEVGTRLDRVHRPRPQWGLLALVCGILMIGFQLQYLTLEIASWDNFISSNSYYQIHWAVSACIGAVILLGVYFLDYTLLGKRPVLCFGVGFVLLVAVLRTSNRINGAAYNIQYWILLAPVLLGVLMYGMRGRGWRGCAACLIGIGAVTLLALMIPSRACALIVCGVGSILLLLSIGKGWMGVPKKKGILVTLLVLLAGIGGGVTCILWNSSYAWNRVIVSIWPDLDPLEGGYAAVIARSLLRGAKWIGEGSREFLTIDSDYPVSRLLPDAQCDYMLTWIVYKLGWLAGLAVVGLLALLLVWMLRKAWKQQGMLGFLVSMAVVLTLAVQTAAYVAFDLGFSLFGLLTLPLISYGGRFMMVHLGLIGLALSVFREEQLPIQDRGGRMIRTQKPAWIVWENGDLVLRFSQWKKAKE